MFRSLLMIVFCWFANQAAASCGLDHCPIVFETDDDVPKPIGVRVQARTHITTFDFKGAKGHYTEWFLSAEYRGLKHWVFGANLPLVLLRVDGENQFGFGNGVVYGEYRTNIAKHGSFGAGLQVELPWGSGGGLSDSHSVLLPYVNAHIPFWRMFVMATVGYAQTIDGAGHHHHHDGHDHGHDDASPSIVYVNPHEAGELVYRTAFGVPLLDGRLQPMMTLNGQQVVLGDGDKTFVQLGARVLGRVSKVWSVHGSLEFPISTARRTNGRGIVGVFADF